jgi:hypothetical protein
MSDCAIGKSGTGDGWPRSYSSSVGFLDGEAHFTATASDVDMRWEIDCDQGAGGFVCRELMGNEITMEVRGELVAPGVARILVSLISEEARAGVAVVTTNMAPVKCRSVRDGEWQCEVPWRGAAHHSVLINCRDGGAVVQIRDAGMH